MESGDSRPDGGCWQQNNAQYEHNDLERKQSAHEKRKRRVVEGDDAALTELAAPKPTNAVETGEDLEDKEYLEKQHSKATSGSHRDYELAEVAVPEPIQHPRSQSPDQNEEEKGTQKSKSREGLDVWNEIIIISWLIFFSFLGTLARLGVEALTMYPYSPFASVVLWANLGGSMFMGFLVQDRRLFRYSAMAQHREEKVDPKDHINRVKKTLPLYIGLSTGFCGSFTSFSTFITDAFLALSNSLAPASATSPYHDISSSSIQPRNGGYSFLAAVGIIIIQSALSISAFKTGSHIAVGIERAVPSLPARLIHKILDPVAPLLGFGCWIGALLLAVFPPAPTWRYRAVMPLVFSPPGTLLRFYLSKYLNSRIPSFPLGTFVANIFGTCIAGMCYDLQHASAIISITPAHNANACAVLEGIIQGFCGCTTTVSTWVSELNGLRRRHAWFYGLTSVAIALGFQIVIMGSMGWTSGFVYRCES